MTDLNVTCPAKPKLDVLLLGRFCADSKNGAKVIKKTKKHIFSGKSDLPFVKRGLRIYVI